MSAQASDLVQTIETDLADASSARDRATSNLDTTEFETIEFETSSLVVALDKVGKVDARRAPKDGTGFVAGSRGFN